MAGIRGGKIRSAALLEVLASITILLTVLSVGTIIYLRVSSSTFTGSMIRAGILLEEKLEATIKTKAYFDDEEERENILISRTVEKYQGNSRLLLIHLTASTREQRVLSEKKQLILINEPQD